MKRITKILALLLVTLLCVWIMPIIHVQAVSTGDTSPESTRYIFKLKANLPQTFSLMSTSSDDGIKPIPYTDGLFTADSMENIQSYIDAGLVEYVEPDGLVYLLDTPITSDPMLSSQWYVNTLEISSAWNKNLTGEGVTVAVIDSGVNASHEDLVGATIDGYSFVGADTTAYGTDSTGHGTFVSGIIAAQTNNGKGLAGLADKVRLLELRCFDSKTANVSNIVSAIAYAVQQKVDVINMSFGGVSATLANSLREQINNAANAGIIMVAAVGNGDNGDVISLNYPAAFDNVIGVGMVNSSGVVDARSQKNSSVYVTAPGVALPGLGSTATNAYGSGSGTSFATPVVASIAAMVKQTNSSIDVEGFKKLLQMCVIDDPSGNGYDTSYGYGIVNAKLLAEALTKDYNITYNCKGGTLSGATGVDYPVTYKIGRSSDVTLGVPTRNGYTFAGWYENPSLTGNIITKVTDSTVGNIAYYAKWYENADTAVKVISVQGVAATADKENSTIYNVALPSNHDKLLASDFNIVPSNIGATVSIPVTSDDGRSWSVKVLAGEGNYTIYTICVSISTYARPWAKGILPSGEATPASYDEEIKAVPFAFVDMSKWFNDIGADTIYSIVSNNGTGVAEISRESLIYTPSQTDTGKTVSLTVGAKNGAFSSNLNETVSIAVYAVPVSNSKILTPSVSFDRNLSKEDATVAINVYGNSLTSISNGEVNLEVGKDYGYNPIEWVGNHRATVYVKASYLRGLSDGEHTLTFQFSGGRSNLEKQGIVAVNISTTTYTVTFESDGSVYSTMQSVVPDTTITLPTVPAKDGYNFEGWFTGVNGTGTMLTASTRINENIRVYAKWSQKSPPVIGGGGFGGFIGVIIPDTVTDAHLPNAVPVSYSLNGEQALANIKETSVTEIKNKMKYGAVIDFSKVSGVKSVSINKPTLDSLISSAKPTDKGITILFPAGGITLSPLALSSIIAKSEGDTSIFSLINAEDLLSSAQKKAAGDYPVYRATIISGTKPVTTFASPLVLELPYNLKEKEKSKEIGASYLDINGNLTELLASYDDSKKMVYTQVSHFSEFAITYKEITELPLVWDNPFSDVATDDWYYNSVAYVCDRGLFNGVSERTFAPNDTMTRGMLVTVLYRMAGQPEAMARISFADVEQGSWYEKAVNWAFANEIVSGVGSNMFAPEAPVTREQMAVILYNYNRYLQKGNTTLSVAPYEMNDFIDNANISSWAYDAMCWAVGNKLISGKTGALLDPKNTAVRAEVATILHRFANK